MLFVVLCCVGLCLAGVLVRLMVACWLDRRDRRYRRDRRDRRGRCDRRDRRDCRTGRNGSTGDRLFYGQHKKHKLRNISKAQFTNSTTTTLQKLSR